jgi:hypothetical protein
MGRLTLIDTRDQAEQMFRTFHARQPRRQVPMRWSWPRRMQEIGAGTAEMYRSNKWKRNPRRFEDYKHLAEGPRATYVTAGFLREWGQPQRRVAVQGDWVNFTAPMPRHFTILAPLLGVQLRLYARQAGGELYLPSDDNLWEVRVSRGMLGAAEHPETGETFLFVYTQSGGVHMLMAGQQLQIGADGIEG